MDWGLELKEGTVSDATEDEINDAYLTFLEGLEADFVAAAASAGPALMLGVVKAESLVSPAVAKHNFRASIVRSAERAMLEGADSEGGDVPASEARLYAAEALTTAEESVATTFAAINAEITASASVDVLGDGDVGVDFKLVALRMIIKKVFSKRRRASRTTSTFIATSVFNAGVLVAGMLLGKTNKTWVSSRDERVRGAHVSLDGVTVPLLGSFDASGVPLRFPGDPAAPPGLSINCRCRLRVS